MCIGREVCSRGSESRDQQTHYKYYQINNFRFMWQNYVNAFLGFCLVVVAFLGLTGITLAWTLGILGAAIIVFGIWGAGVLSTESETKVRHA